MTIKIELGLAALTALVAAGIFHTERPLAPLPPAERTTSFAADDYAAFDRDFLIGGDACAVGLQKRDLCFKQSPLQASIIEGQDIPANIPLLAAEFPILVELPVKQARMKLLRYGTTLVLIDGESRTVQDVLFIDADTYADASRAPQTELVTTTGESKIG